MLNVLLIRPGESPAAVTVPENAIALTETAIRALIGAANTERHPGLWAGVIGDLYTDAKAVAQNMPLNDAASELRAAAIRRGNPASKDAAVLRGVALLVQMMPDYQAGTSDEISEITEPMAQVMRENSRALEEMPHASGTFANEAERQESLAGPDGATPGCIVEVKMFDEVLDEEAIRRLSQ